ncbi:MAG: hypothetical protein JNL74_20445 [Fibrobacteres bacterium]|nr:hypothetical protein [Fibrobacterota bacterium]
MKKIVVFTLIWLAMVLVSSCEKAIEPDGSNLPVTEKYIVRLNAEIVAGTTIDTAVVRVLKDSSTWDSDALASPYVVYVYRNTISANPLLVARKIFNYSGSAPFVVYGEGETSTQVDTVFPCFSNELKFVVDQSFVDSFYYTAIVVANVKEVSGANRYYEGRVGVFSKSNSLIVGSRTGLVLANGDVETEINLVSFSAIIPSKDVKKLILHRYSALRSLSSIDSVVSWSEKYKGDSIKSNDTLLGYILRPDTIVLNNASSVKQETLGVSGIKVTGKVKLAPFYGRKYCLVQCVDSLGKKVGDLLWDDINLRISYASLDFDEENARRDSFFVDKITNRLCVLHRAIPIKFDTYADSTFDSKVEIWVATRKLSSTFLNTTGWNIASGSMVDINNKFVKWGDCIFETAPEKFTLSAGGKLRTKILSNFDYKKGFRVSPLAFVSSHDSLGWKSNNFSEPTALGSAGIIRSPINKAVISRLVKCGSILGHDTAKLDNFDASLIYVSHPDSASVNAPNWFTYTPIDDIKNSGSKSIYQYVSRQPKFKKTNEGIYNSLALAYSVDYSKNLYDHPFKGIPVTSVDVNNGTKEFVIIAITKGRFFGETRVYFSSDPDKNSYVWDAIPPQFKWAFNENSTVPIISPAQSFAYAPLCYKAPGVSNCTDFSLFTTGLFDVFLSTIDLKKKACSIRDVGFGKIKSFKLKFNYSSEFLGSDPETGERYYLAPSVERTLSSDILQRQDRVLYYAGNDPIGNSYALSGISFKNIDFSGWKPGVWDMWVETEDDLGNRGLAPYAGALSSSSGEVSIRQIEIK